MKHLKTLPYWDKGNERVRFLNLRIPEFTDGGRALSNIPKMSQPDDAKWVFRQYRCGFGSGTFFLMKRNSWDKSDITPRKKGQKVIMKHMTGKAKRKIRIGAKDLDWQHLNLGAQKPFFAALTAPRGNDGERIMEGAWRRLNRMIKRRYQPLQDEEFQFIKVSQVQPERLKKRKERVIHFHLIWNYPVNQTELMRMWKHCLNLEYKAEAMRKSELFVYQCPPYVRVYNKPVEASAEQYITKYLSEFDPKLAIEGNNYSISRNLLQFTKPTRQYEVDGNYSDFVQVLSETLYELKYKTPQQLNVISYQDDWKGEIMHVTCNDLHTTMEFLWIMSHKLSDIAYPINRPKGVLQKVEPTEGWA